MVQDKKTYQTIRVEDAVGSTLAHDITEIRPGEFKGPSFRRGQKIEEKDICRLMKLGKRHLYVLDLGKDEVHEDDAALELVSALSGKGVKYSSSPKEGKLSLIAGHDGLVKVNADGLREFNMVPEVMCASIHNNTQVKKGQQLAGTRAIPLVIKRDILDAALQIAADHTPIFTVKKFKRVKARLIITGSEIYEGLIDDRFEEVVRKKITDFGSTLEETVILPDDRDLIADTVQSFLEKGTELIITTGGMSVDPDDVTRAGIIKAGIEEIYYSAAVLPGAMFQIAYKGEATVMGIPACALYHSTTVFDLILPRIFAGEKVDNRDLAGLSHGGLCLNCDVCRYPVCPFGKGC
ncbi:MAG: molybdopterin-binding protein [Deltaproteobacteria bacterium]|nr:molybdopterin-binding protein [Deltaproteobacteria bacterium]